MNNNKNLEQTADILRLAVPQMASLNIPVTPANYAVWFEYFAETNLNLKRAIDGLIANEVVFTAEVNHGLYNRFIEERSPEVIENVQIETQILINSLFNKIEQLSTGTEAFSTNLNKFGDELQQDPTPETLNNLIVSLASEVESVLATNKEMKQSLDTLGSELTSLKGEMENLSKVAMTDELTSLNNRRAYEMFATDQVTLFNEQHVGCSLMVLDIDHFKQFNDTYGHLVGDKVLAYVALALKQAVKGEDFVARYGGEEFVILLPDTKLSDAVTVAEKIRQRIAQKQLTIGKENKQQLGHITISIGVAAIQNGDDMDTLLARADEQLYNAKASGRNCVKY
ncbi:GGDEF domain-containing protein [Shewanella sp. WXL01]|uniref:diguanylate cyclase n=1 Tax=Shewanella maritima TaxID=2520507 RepID=A0A411PCY4_9GAMM|nr:MULTISPECIES: GGDEF domain-containing protein [Shewanella]NKF50639.1 GGDEF domain-containing protein [Shewanella sp. WXL01]QBF81374.1 GGDEF domain-containing protein [Shewanella maritima]